LNSGYSGSIAVKAARMAKAKKPKSATGHAECRLESTASAFTLVSRSWICCAVVSGWPSSRSRAAQRLRRPGAVRWHGDLDDQLTGLLAEVVAGVGSPNTQVGVARLARYRAPLAALQGGRDASAVAGRSWWGRWGGRGGGKTLAGRVLGATGDGVGTGEVLRACRVWWGSWLLARRR
jgi:hypothetical protein